MLRLHNWISAAINTLDPKVQRDCWVNSVDIHILIDFTFLSRHLASFYCTSLWFPGTCHHWIMESPCVHQPGRGWPCKSFSWIVLILVLDNPQVHKTGFNHYSAECLVKGGGREEGVMDFVQYVFHAVLFLQADFSPLTRPLSVWFLFRTSGNTGISQSSRLDYP